MPFLNGPEQMRAKAMRSRCFGSMFAWILKMKPENCGCSGAMSVEVPFAPSADGLLFADAGQVFLLDASGGIHFVADIGAMKGVAETPFGELLITTPGAYPTAVLR